MQFKSFINYIVFKRLKKRGLIIKHFVDWWENQPLDKSTSYAISKYFPNSIIKANLGYIPRLNEYQLSPLKVEIEYKVVPFNFLTSGEEVSKIIKKFNNNLNCRVTPSLRYLNILDKFNKSNNNLNLKKYSFNILVGLTIYKSEFIIYFKLSKQYLNTENNLAIYIKCHPANIIDIKSYFYNCKNIKVYDDFIFDKEFKFAITGMSTISYELLTFGIPIIVCNESRNFNFLPDLSKIDKKYWQICSNQKNLILV